MFIASRREDWAFGMMVLGSAETIEEMGDWIADYILEEEGGSKVFVFKVDYAPVMQYTVIQEVRGDAWDGTAKP